MRIRKVYTCVVCGKSWDSVQSLRAHVKCHRDVKFENFTVRLPRQICEAFRAVCEKHKTTTCSLALALLQAVIKGDELGVVNIGSENPFVVQVNHFFAARPRGHGKYEVEAVVEGLGEHLIGALMDPRGKNWPPSCLYADDFIKGSCEVGCLRVRGWLSLRDCWVCFLRGEGKSS